ncbi:hypothetical protein B0T26DRAFT_679327 [Lasiosphaeria miniovina]|uniref:Oxidoreductase acuF-like C2H2 type zinc-finger domain-containing protein n=1 Tax=Lasiosphaeria miniovina TaxID=1954250 RepID=A0AA40A674_9PEZI|nr:uncharacterized protein B0T26DRAFT_679327 [Lasiosphaeria miniovina]KAK0709992.1 hypothetical protein B0T26DRAFT_679327 [Lasiosphaeria miniovina]
MPSFPPGLTISAKSQHVRQRFHHLISILKGREQHGVSVVIPSASITDALERFTLWAGNLGALRNPQAKMSLDYRLSVAKAVDVRTQIQRQLDEMSEAVKNLGNMTFGVVPNRDLSFDDDELAEFVLVEDVSVSGSEATGKPADEANMILEIISECIKSLFRIGIVVRKSAPRDRFQRAMQLPGLAFPADFDIDYVKQKHPKVVSTGLSGRLGGAIAKRRQFIKYSRDHKSRLGAEDRPKDEKAVDVNLELHSVATDLLSSKATTFDPSKTGEANFEDEGEEFNDAMSIKSASTITEALSVLKLPRLADLAPDDEPFECPVCFTLQSFKHERSWRSHALRDLKAFVCTLGGSDCDAEFFVDAESWFEHELKQHRAQYKCVLCSHGPVPAKALGEHITSAHGPFPADQLGMLLEAGQQAVTKFKARDCPFCDDWASALARKTNLEGKPGTPAEEISVTASRFKRHVAAHQEQLAIFALPRATEEPGSSRQGSTASSQSTEESVREQETNKANIKSWWQDIEANPPQAEPSQPEPAISAIPALRLPTPIAVAASEPELSRQPLVPNIPAPELGPQLAGQRPFSVVPVPRRPLARVSKTAPPPKSPQGVPYYGIDSNPIPARPRPPVKFYEKAPELQSPRETSYYGDGPTVTPASLRPRAITQNRPTSYYASLRPPSNLRFYAQQPQPPPQTSLDEDSDFPRQVYPMPPSSYMPPPPIEYFSMRPLQSRFRNGRPTGMAYYPPPTFSSYDDSDVNLSPLSRRPSAASTNTDSQVMPPPPRPSSATDFRSLPLDAYDEVDRYEYDLASRPQRLSQDQPSGLRVAVGMNEGARTAMSPPPRPSAPMGYRDLQIRPPPVPPSGVNEYKHYLQSLPSSRRQRQADDLSVGQSIAPRPRPRTTRDPLPSVTYQGSDFVTQVAGTGTRTRRLAIYYGDPNPSLTNPDSTRPLPPPPLTADTLRKAARGEKASDAVVVDVRREGRRKPVGPKEREEHMKWLRQEQEEHRERRSAAAGDSAGTAADGKQQRRVSPASPTRSSGSRGEDDGAKSRYTAYPDHTTRGSRAWNPNEHNNDDEDVTIRITGNTVLRIGDTEMKVTDGAEIKIPNSQLSPGMQAGGTEVDTTKKSGLHVDPSDSAKDLLITTSAPQLTISETAGSYSRQSPAYDRDSIIPPYPVYPTYPTEGYF